MTRVLTILLACALSPTLAQEADPLEVFLRGVDQELRGGQVRDAAKAYLEVADDADAPARLRARALWRLTRCRELLGDAAGSREAAQRLVDEHPTSPRVDDARGVLRALEDEQAGAKRELSLERNGELVSLKCSDASIVDVLLTLAAEAKLGIVISPEVTGTITTELTNVRPLDALTSIVATAGVFALVHDREANTVRVQTQASLHTQLELRAYRLKPPAPGLRGWQRRQATISGLTELVHGKGIQGTSASYDPTTCTVFVATTALEHDAVGAFLGEQLQRRSQRAFDGPRVTVMFKHANVRTIYHLIAAYAEVGVLAAPEVMGQISVHLEDVPFDVALREITRAVGPYRLVETEACYLVLPPDRAEQWLQTVSWKVAKPPVAHWRAGGQLLQDSSGMARALGDEARSSEDWPRHPLTNALGDYAASLGIPGATVFQDPVSHRLVARLPRHLAAKLERELVGGGVIEQPARPPVAGGKLESWNDAAVRSLFSNAASELGVNVVLGPEVVGNLAGSFRRTGDPRELLGALAIAAGPFRVTEDAGVYRVGVPQGDLITVSLRLKSRSSETLGSLRDGLSDLVVGLGVSGALVVSNPATQSLVISAPRWLIPELRDVVAACDEVALPEDLVLCAGNLEGDDVLWLSVWQVEAGVLRPAGEQSLLTQEADGPAQARAAIGLSPRDPAEDGAPKSVALKRLTLTRSAAHVQVKIDLHGRDPLEFELFDLR